MSSLPVGPEVPSHPSPAPTRTTIVGEHVTLVPLSAPAHAPALYAETSSSPAVWTYMPVGPFTDESEFADYIAAQSESKDDDPLFFTVLLNDNSSDDDEEEEEEEKLKKKLPVGFLSLLNISLPTRSVEVGNITFSPRLQRTTAATEALYLIMRYCMVDLEARRLEWKCDSLNAKSRRAAERLGFAYEGLFRQHRIVKGKNRDTAWFSIVDGEEWEVVKGALEKWLDGSNFEEGEEGKKEQKKKLEDIRGELAGKKKEA